MESILSFVNSMKNVIGLVNSKENVFTVITVKSTFGHVRQNIFSEKHYWLYESSGNLKKCCNFTKKNITFKVRKQEYSNNK